MSKDPVFVLTETKQDEYKGEMLPGWYFFDETWADCHGPFATEQGCRESLKAYAKQL